MKWITRAQVKVDRVACPWLIRKFVDQDAEFYFVPADKVMEEAKRPGATPFDVTNVELGHHGGDVSFNSILKKCGLADPRYNCPERSSEPPIRIRRTRILQAKGEGLRWIAHGLSTLGLNDREILAREFIVYDALYAECQQRVTH